MTLLRAGMVSGVLGVAIGSFSARADSINQSNWDREEGADEDALWRITFSAHCRALLTL